MTASQRVAGAESARKALRLLLAFDERRPRASVRELAAAAGLPASTSYRLLALLVESGLVERVERARYGVTGRVQGLARAADAASDLLIVARTPMEALRRETGEAVILIRAFGDIAVSVGGAVPPHAAHLTGASGRVFPLHRGAPAKLLLSARPASVRKAYLDRVARADPGFGARRAAFERELAAIRRQGSAESVEEVDAGAWAAAAPIERDGEWVAALMIGVALDRLDLARRRALRAAVERTARRIGAAALSRGKA